MYFDSAYKTSKVTVGNGWINKRYQHALSYFWHHIMFNLANINGQFENRFYRRNPYNFWFLFYQERKRKARMEKDEIMMDSEKSITYSNRSNSWFSRRLLAYPDLYIYFFLNACYEIDVKIKILIFQITMPLEQTAWSSRFYVKAMQIWYLYMPLLTGAVMQFKPN